MLCFEHDEVPCDLTCSGKNMLCFKRDEVPYDLTCSGKNMLCFESDEVPYDFICSGKKVFALSAMRYLVMTLYPERKCNDIISGIEKPRDISLNVLIPM